MNAKTAAASLKAGPADSQAYGSVHRGLGELNSCTCITRGKTHSWNFMDIGILRSTGQTASEWHEVSGSKLR